MEIDEAAMDSQAHRPPRLAVFKLCSAEEIINLQKQGQKCIKQGGVI